MATSQCDILHVYIDSTCIRVPTVIASTDVTTSDDQQARNDHLAALLASCERGNESAFEELYTLCSAQLYSVLLRILNIEAVAEEALQDSFVKIWQKSGTYVPESGTPMTWMCSIARHQALDQLRRRSTREARERTDAQAIIASTPDRSKSPQAMSDDAQRLMQCLEQLPPDARRCVVMAYCEGYSHEELSEKHKRPVGTIKSWIRRGLISLRSCIDELA